MRIVFMGTPDFAVSSLEILLKNNEHNNINVVGIITATDKLGGRGNQLLQSDVKRFALQYDIPILQPEKLKDEDFLAQLKALKADLQIVVAFRMLPEVVWNMPALGTFNLHASLLPQYRGSAPINWAIINGETETGITTFFLKQEIDTGDLIFQEKTAILPEDNFETLYNKMKLQGAELVLKTVKAIQEKNYTPIPQAEIKDLKTAPKIFKETCEINFKEKTALEVHNFVRGLSPVPCAWTTLLGKHCKIYKTALLENNENPENLPFKTDNKTFLHLACKDGFLAIEELQMEGKKRLAVKDFLNGYKF